MVSNVKVTEYADGSHVDIVARGGSRRERGAAIAHIVKGRNRDPFETLTRVSVSYSETYGFLPATYATYRVTDTRK